MTKDEIWEEISDCLDIHDGMKIVTINTKAIKRFVERFVDEELKTSLYVKCWDEDKP